MRPWARPRRSTISVTVSGCWARSSRIFTLVGSDSPWKKLPRTSCLARASARSAAAGKLLRRCRQGLRRRRHPAGDPTDPPIAVVGETEAEVRARHHPAVAATTPLMYVPRAGAVHRTTGFVRLGWTLVARYTPLGYSYQEAL